MLRKELDLLKYKMANNNELESMDVSTDSVLSLNQAIFQEYSELIRRTCESIKFARDKERYDVEFEQARARLNQILKKEYSGEELQLYMRYIKSHLMVNC